MTGSVLRLHGCGDEVRCDERHCSRRSRECIPRSLAGCCFAIASLPSFYLQLFAHGGSEDSVRHDPLPSSTNPFSLLTNFICGQTSWSDWWVVRFRFGGSNNSKPEGRHVMRKRGKSHEDGRHETDEEEGAMRLFFGLHGKGMHVFVSPLTHARVNCFVGWDDISSLLP